MTGREGRRGGRRSGGRHVHAAAPEPRYYYSHVGEALRAFSAGDNLEPYDPANRRWLRQTPDCLAEEFARHVAEHLELDSLALLFRVPTTFVLKYTLSPHYSVRRDKVPFLSGANPARQLSCVDASENASPFCVSSFVRDNGVSMLSRAGSREGIVRLGW